MRRAGRALLPLGVLIFVLGLASIVIAVKFAHGAPLPIAFGELAISAGISCCAVGALAWIITRHSVD